MGRRKRRGSTSSVETVDESGIHWLQESSVLRAAPKGKPEDEWPEFELRDAIVLNKDGRTIENALHVAVEGPFIVRGRLIIDDDRQASCLIMKVRSAPIEIRPVASYSIGDDYGRPVIWVLGRGGWFEMNPSPAYRSMFNKMCQATTLYYSLVDIYSEKSRPKPKKLSAAETKQELSRIFLRYATAAGDGSTLEDVYERCGEHAIFLFTQFIQETTIPFAWDSTLFYKWLTSKYPDVFKKTQEMIRNPPATTRSPPPARAEKSHVKQALPSRVRQKSPVSSTETSSLEEIDAKDFVPRKRAAPSSSVSQRGSAPATEKPKAQIATTTRVRGADDETLSKLLEAIEETYKTKLQTRKPLTVSALINKVYFENKFPNYRASGAGSHKVPVEEVFHYYAKALLQAFDRPRYGPEVYGWLQDLSQKEFAPIALKPSDFPYHLQPRGARPPRQANPLAIGTPSELGDSSSHSHGGDGVSSQSEGRARPGKSMKQPGKKHARKSGLRLTTGSVKRPHSEISDSESEASGTKRSHYFSDDDAMDDAADTSSQDNGMVGRQGAALGEDLPGQTPIKIAIRADRIPSTVAQGPDGIWACDQDGCDFILRGVDGSERQARIREHFLEHEEETERVNLALTESRGHLPINHLLEKIKRLGERSQAEQQMSPLGGEMLPQPIKRKLIV